VNDLLDMAKIEAGKATINLSEFKISDTLAGLRGLFRPLATNERVKLIFDTGGLDTPEKPLYLCTDEGKLAQILRNFIANALKFTERGTVTVSAKRLEGGAVLFSVADTGVGIAPEHFEIVMQEWGQIEGGSSHRQKGSGLGLPLSRQLAELLGGHLWFDSTLGVGSTFYLSLPARVARREGECEHSGPMAAPRHILVADDDEVSRYLLRRKLATLTVAAVVEVKDSKECLQSILSNPPQILFLDLMMPGVSGIELARQLRSRPATADLAIVAVSAKVLTEEERGTLEAMHIPVISKRLGEGERDQAQHDEDSVVLERALLQVGLSNLHQGAAKQ
jgi:CheY-like chemotaxis protein